MAIGAHPDDIEFGCGGTLLNHTGNGDKVIYVCMTDTESLDATTGEIIRSHKQLKEEHPYTLKFCSCRVFRICALLIIVN